MVRHMPIPRLNVHATKTARRTYSLALFLFLMMDGMSESSGQYDLHNGQEPRKTEASAGQETMQPTTLHKKIVALVPVNSLEMLYPFEISSSPLDSA